MDASPLASPLADPLFFAAALPAVALVGLSKGGLGGGVGLVGVPLLSLVVPPVQAAAILLPILVVMDLVSLWAWRGAYDRQILLHTLLWAMPGIALGWWLASAVTPDAVRLVVGAVALAFAGRWASGLLRGGREIPPARPSAVRGGFWGFVAGFTSFVAHVGGPPLQIYMLPLKLSPALFTGTGVVFFAVTNAVKLAPYAALGQFDAQNLWTSAALMPLAPASTLLGAWLVRRMRADIFYLFTYATVTAVAAKLVWDGLAATI